MKKILKQIKNHILLSTIIMVVAFIAICFVNKLFGVMFRQWVYLAIILIAIIGSIIGIIQIIRKRNKYIKILLIVFLVSIFIFIIAFWPIILLGVAFSYEPEHVIEKDNKKYVAYVESFLKVNVYYYDYINFFLVGNKVKIHEFYGNGGYDPFDGEHSDSEVKSYYYYDDEGNLIDTNE